MTAPARCRHAPLTARGAVWAQKDDPRITAAMTWLKKTYTLDENPGLGKQGLFYYYHTFAKALDAVGQKEFVDAKGVKLSDQDIRKTMTDLLTVAVQQIKEGK